MPAPSQPQTLSAHRLVDVVEEMVRDFADGAVMDKQCHWNTGA